MYKSRPCLSSPLSYGRDRIKSKSERARSDSVCGLRGRLFVRERESEEVKDLTALRKGTLERYLDIRTVHQAADCEVREQHQRNRSSIIIIMSQYPSENELFENHFGQFTPQVIISATYISCSNLKLVLYNREFLLSEG